MDRPAQLDPIWTWRNAHMRSVQGSSPTGDRTWVARLTVQCSTDWATPSSNMNERIGNQRLWTVEHLVQFPPTRWSTISILIWLDSFPLLSQRTRTVLYSPDISTGSKPRPPVLHVTAVSRVNFLFSFFHKKDISWVIIRIEIKMKSSALLPSNLPRVISRLGDKFDRSMTLGL